MNKPYSIDFVTNTITVSKKFHEASQSMENAEFNTMMKLRNLNMTIVIKQPTKKKNSAITYGKMAKYISCLDESEKYMREFEAVREESQSHNAPYHYVAKWFDNTFPNYNKMPERNEDLKIVNTPANYANEEAA